MLSLNMLMYSKIMKTFVHVQNMPRFYTLIIEADFILSRKIKTHLMNPLHLLMETLTGQSTQSIIRTARNSKIFILYLLVVFFSKRY